jgi:hypothetical protein
VTTPPGVDPNVIQKSNDPEVQGTADDDSVLPFTGGDILLFVVIGFAAIGAGTVTLRAVRYRRGSAGEA